MDDPTDQIKMCLGLMQRGLDLDLLKYNIKHKMSNSNSKILPPLRKSNK